MSLASRGLRNISDRNEKIEDPNELRQVRRQARRVMLKGILVAIPLTLIVYIIP
ncbi:MAG TPA: hypothetical protein VJM08_18590 [Anaerolineales bacterium]|nr:hypothetical protein [Anaerolineales bacterium]